jgi:hypothetical protein
MFAGYLFSSCVSTLPRNMIFYLLNLGLDGVDGLW